MDLVKIQLQFDLLEAIKTGKGKGLEEALNDKGMTLEDLDKELLIILLKRFMQPQKGRPKKIGSAADKRDRAISAAAFLVSEAARHYGIEETPSFTDIADFVRGIGASKHLKRPKSRGMAWYDLLTHPDRDEFLDRALEKSGVTNEQLNAFIDLK